ncbi:hypothetical protein [Alloactinosynnema sp. L-07]|nr:hypothetical protein [Alloactinosynnema sp. L-07]
MPPLSSEEDRGGIRSFSPAASYSPTPSRVQYHRRWQA